MGIFPKYKVGSYGIHYRYDPSEGRHIEELFQVRKRSLLWDRWIPEWSYFGWCYEVISANPLKIKYSTTTGIRERDFVPLESRLLMDKSHFYEPERLEPMNPELHELGLRLAPKKE